MVFVSSIVLPSCKKPRAQFGQLRSIELRRLEQRATVSWIETDEFTHQESKLDEGFAERAR